MIKCKEHDAFDLFPISAFFYSSGRGCLGAGFIQWDDQLGPAGVDRGRGLAVACRTFPWGAISQLTSPMLGPAVEMPRMLGRMLWDQTRKDQLLLAPCIQDLLGSWSATSYFSLLEFWRKGSTDTINLDVLIRQYLALPLPLIQNGTCSFNTLDPT